MNEGGRGATGTLTALQVGLGWFDEQRGGLNRMVAGLVRHLPDVGVRAPALVAGSPAVLRASSGLARSFAPGDASLPLRLLRARRAIAGALRDDPPDLIASHFALYTVPALDLVGDRPLVVHFHGPWAAEGTVEGTGRLGSRAKALVERRVYRRADRAITLSHPFAQVLSRSYGVPAERITVIPGGVDAGRLAVETSPEEARRRLGLPTDRPLVLSVRRLARRMGLDNLLSAIDLVRRRVPEVLAVIAGGGPLAADLEAQVALLGLEDHVRFPGPVPDGDLPLLYRAATVTVVPSVALEGFGLTAAESLAAGTPVLVTPVGGMPEVVLALDPALVMEGSGARDIAAHLQAFLTGDLTPPGAAACREHARSLFDWPVIAARTRQVYLDVLA